MNDFLWDSRPIEEQVSEAATAVLQGVVGTCSLDVDGVSTDDVLNTFAPRLAAWSEWKLGRAPEPTPLFAETTKEIPS